MSKIDPHDLPEIDPTLEPSEMLAEIERCPIRQKHNAYVESEYSPDPQIPDFIREYPHDIGSRLAVLTAKYLRDCGVYQENIDITALAGQIGRSTKDFDVRDHSDIDQTLAIHATALSGAFLAFLEGKTEGEDSKASAERIRIAMQMQQQYRQTLYLADMLQSTRRKIKERWVR